MMTQGDEALITLWACILCIMAIVGIYFGIEYIIEKIRKNRRK
jgi:hypothetical protein